MQRANRKDSNHAEIAKAFQDRGFVVLDISQLKNCCDIFVAKNQVTIAVEIKSGIKKKLTSGEIKFAEKWIAGGGIWKRIDNVEDVMLLDCAYFGVLYDVKSENEIETDNLKNKTDWRS